MNQERLLIERTRLLNDREAFSRLVKIHQSRLRAFLFRLSRDTDIADDLAQETFIKAYTRIKSYRGDSTFQTWLFAIAYKEFLQHSRTGKRRRELTESYQLQMQQQSLQSWYETISAGQLDLERAMAALKPLEAAAITLCHSFGASHQEVAEILEIPLGTVKSRILRGKEKLRRHLQAPDYREQIL